MIGRIIDGRYVVEGELGRGGMGVVLKVKHRFTGAQHALKMLRPDYAMDQDVQNRFLAEARAATAIGHPGIVAVLDAGKTPEGELYLVMELLQGQPLRAAITRTGMAPPELRRIGTELLDALAAAHARGFVHRDLKPENVFLCAPNGTVKLLDFGIAKVAAATNMTAMPQTAAGVVLGTLAYMAPEQLHDARSVDPRADLWAIGAMFYELLAGRLPWKATTMTELYIQLESAEPTPISTYLPGAPPQVQAFFARALARDPRGRFQSAQEMSAALAQLPATQATQATGPGPVARPVMATQMTGGAWAAGTAPTAATGLGTVATGPGIAATAMSAPGLSPPTAGGSPIPPTAPMHPPSVNVAPTANVAAPVKRNWLGIGLAGLAALLIATAIVIAQRSAARDQAVVDDTKPLTIPEKKLADVKGVDVPLPPAPPPASPPDAGVKAKPVDKTVTRPPPAQNPPPPQANPPPAQTSDQPSHQVWCQNACAAMAKCGFGVANCLTTCKDTPANRKCGDAVTDCNALASCVIADSCNGAGPRGGASCGQTFSCFTTCNNNMGCACRCFRSMAEEHAALMMQFIVCAAGCSGEGTCIQQRCAGLTQSCLGQ